MESESLVSNWETNCADLRVRRVIDQRNDLLSSLEQVVEWLDRSGESRSAGGMEYGYVKDARAAIARAKGGQ